MSTFSQALKSGILPSVSKFDIEDKEVLREARALEEGVKTLSKKDICVPSLKRQRALVAQRRQKRVRINRGFPVEVVHLDHTLDEDEIEQVMRPDNEDIIDLDCQINEDIIGLDCQILVGSSDEEESESFVTVEDEEYQENLRKIKINESLCHSNSINLLLDEESDDDIEVLEERLVRKLAEKGPRRRYKDREPIVKKEVILGEVSEQEIFSLQDSDLELFETFPPFQAVEYGPILDLSESSQDLIKSMMGELPGHKTKAAIVESESDEGRDESESVKQLQVDKNMFGALGRSLGSFGGERKVSCGKPFRSCNLFKHCQGTQQLKTKLAKLTIY